MADAWMLCANSTGGIIPIALERSEAKARDIAYDGDFYLIPIQIGRVYDNLVDVGIVGAVGFQNTSQKTSLQQAREIIVAINGRLDTIDNQIGTIITQGQAINQSVQALDDRVGVLEGPT